MYGVYYADIMQFIGQNTAHNHSLNRISESNIGSPFWIILSLTGIFVKKSTRYGKVIQMGLWITLSSANTSYLSETNCAGVLRIGGWQFQSVRSPLAKKAPRQEGLLARWRQTVWQ